VRAFLLAGGEGRRLRPLTARMPKCLVPIRGTPLLAFWLDALERQSVGVVLINVSQHADQVEHFLESRRGRPLRVQLVRESRPVGNAGTVAANRGFVDGEENFWIIYSDNLTNMDFGPMAARHVAHHEPLTIALFRTPFPRASGIVTMEPGGRIVRFEEKPAHPASDLANAGIYLARQSLFQWIPPGRATTDFGHDVLPRLAGRMYGHEVEGYFADIGTPERLARAEAEWPG
jgi:mannose-1-phosphate guanylyltransferase